MAKRKGRQADGWLEAKRRCRLSEEDIRMAKELGFKPRSLIKNIPAKSQPWKAPVREWIRDLYAKRFGKTCYSSPDHDEQEPLRLPPQTTPDPLTQEDLQPQYDTVNEEPYFVRESDGRIFSLEEAGRYFIDRDAEKNSIEEEDWPSLEEANFEEDFEPSQQEIDNEDGIMLRRQEQFRLAAGAVATAMSRLPEVEKIVLFGSVTKLLGREVPRFRRFRQAQIELWHECKDVDLAVWVSSLDHLKTLQKARSQTLNKLMAKRNIGVAHHQVDVFLLELGTDRYLGRLCCFGQCPKSKKECSVEGCGRKPFLQWHEDFEFDWSLALQDSILLYEKNGNEPTHL